MSPHTITYTEAKQLCQFEFNNLRAFASHWEKDNQHYNFRLYNGAVEFEDLNLETEEYPDDILGIIVKGNLTVGNIFNFETDYGMHLVVIGDLSANNIAVGGQDIHVTGNLTVQEVFMGSYNHGTIVVSGNVNCPIIIIDDYSFCTMGQVDGTVYGNEAVYFMNGSEQTMIHHAEEEGLKEVFDDSVFGDYGLDFDIIANKVASHQSFLRPGAAL